MPPYFVTPTDEHVTQTIGVPHSKPISDVHVCMPQENMVLGERVKQEFCLHMYAHPLRGAASCECTKQGDHVFRLVTGTDVFVELKKCIHIR